MTLKLERIMPRVEAAFRVSIWCATPTCLAPRRGECSDSVARLGGTICLDNISNYFYSYGIVAAIDLVCFWRHPLEFMPVLYSHLACPTLDNAIPLLKEAGEPTGKFGLSC